MSISNVSLANSQHINSKSIETDQKTVHKQDINNLKQEIKSLSNKLDDLSKKSEPKTMNSLSFMTKNVAMHNAKKNISQGKVTIINLKDKVADLKGKISLSSYKHNASKMKSLNQFESQLSNLSASLKSSDKNIKNIVDMDNHIHKITSPEYLETQANERQELKEIHKQFMKDNPNYFEGGMVK